MPTGEKKTERIDRLEQAIYAPDGFAVKMAKIETIVGDTKDKVSCMDQKLTELARHFWIAVGVFIGLQFAMNLALKMWK